MDDDVNGCKECGEECYCIECGGDCVVACKCNWEEEDGAHDDE